MHNQLPGAYKDPLRHIPFRSLRELEAKIEKVKYIQKLNHAQLKTFLQMHKLEFSELEDGSLIIEKGVPEALQPVFIDIIEAMKARIKEVYDAVGIITTEIPADYDKNLYTGLIDSILYRNN